jgi:hypothetical protein
MTAVEGSGDGDEWWYGIGIGWPGSPSVGGARRSVAESVPPPELPDITIDDEGDAGGMSKMELLVCSCP